MVTGTILMGKTVMEKIMVKMVGKEKSFMRKECTEKTIHMVCTERRRDSSKAKTEKVFMKMGRDMVKSFSTEKVKMDLVRTVSMTKT